MNNPIVSICVQTYNHKDYIKPCLDGILMQQTTFPFEIILGEDESDDGTRKICIEYANTYPDIIKLFLRSRKDVIYINGQATGRYNFMENLKACKGKYIALCEGDDYWTDPLKLQKQVDFLEAHSDYNICFHEVIIFREEENKFSKENIILREIAETTGIGELAKGNFMHTPSVVLRNNFSIPTWLCKTPIGDWPLYMIVVKDKKIKKLTDTMAVYRIHRLGIWARKTPKTRILNTIKTYKLFMSKNKVNNNVKEIIKSTITELKNDLQMKSNLFRLLLNKIK